MFEWHSGGVLALMIDDFFFRLILNFGSFLLIWQGGRIYPKLKAMRCMLVDTFPAFREPLVVCSYNGTLKIPKSDVFVIVSLGLNEVIRDSKFVVRKRVGK
jgi:hypothetical protein